MTSNELNIATCEPKDLLKELIRFKSLSTQENDLVNWLEAKVRKTGLLTTERYGDNLIFSIGTGKPWLFLNSHSDVVPPSPQHLGDAFKPIEKEGRIYGRGSTDAKGCGTAMLLSLVRLAKNGFKPSGKVSFALTVCEETAGEFNGMHYLTTSVIEKPDAALIGEPTLLSPCIAQKGLLIVRLVTKGDSGHSARVEGNNAILLMANDLIRISEIKFSLKNDLIGFIKITPTLITGGTANNANPERCEVILDIRTIPEIPVQNILKKMNDILNSELQVISDRFIATQTDPESIIAKICKVVSGNDFFGSPTSSDWVFLADVPTVKIGPGNSEYSHKADEYIDIQQLNSGVELYTNIIKSYFGEEY